MALPRRIRGLQRFGLGPGAGWSGLLRLESDGSLVEAPFKQGFYLVVVGYDLVLQGYYKHSDFPEIIWGQSGIISEGFGPCPEILEVIWAQHPYFGNIRRFYGQTAIFPNQQIFRIYPGVGPECSRPELPEDSILYTRHSKCHVPRLGALQMGVLAEIPDYKYRQCLSGTLP